MEPGRIELHLNALIHDRENKKYLPGVNFGDNLNVETSIEETVDGVEMILFSVPAQYFRDAFKSVLPHIKPETIIVNVAKGIEQKNLMRLSESVTCMTAGNVMTTSVTYGT